MQRNETKREAFAERVAMFNEHCALVLCRANWMVDVDSAHSAVDADTFSSETRKMIEFISCLAEHVKRLIVDL